MAGWNDEIIDEFRTKGGKVGGPFEGRKLLLLHHTGAKSGIERCNPLAYQQLDGGSFAVFASKGGAPTNPDWYYNLQANPRASVEVDGKTIPVIARIPDADEREGIWTKQKQDWQGFADYEKKTSRTIPVVILDRA